MPNRTVAVGAFVIGGLLLFAVGLYLIGNRRMMFSDTVQIYAEYSRIAGLQPGAIVRVAGLDAGEVEQVSIPTSPSAKFRVRLRIREDVHHLIRYDSVASIQNDGLVGNKFVQIEAGTEGAAQVPPGGTISGAEPVDLGQMLQKMNETVDMVTVMIKDVKTGIDEALSAVTATAVDAQALMKDTGAEIRAITGSAERLAGDIQAIVAGVRSGRGSVGKLLNDDDLYNRIRSIAGEAEKTMIDLRAAAASAKDAVNDFRGEDGPVRGVMGDLQLAISAARETMTDLADNAEALKRNFLFRGFFNRRGFFDLQDISVEDYRDGALETDTRKVLRIWASAEVLFTQTPDGVERLTDDGRRRLDSAMAPYLRYPRTTPIVVEGYAGPGTSDEQFLLSRSRAQAVRDYIVGRFGLDARYVATMPMGSNAPGSPRGNQWEGVALAAFVELAGK
jgi:phospholipid/cholesterol/gamma-HCH transport system substrate-binding protein